MYLHHSANSCTRTSADKMHAFIALEYDREPMDSPPMGQLESNGHTEHTFRIAHSSTGVFSSPKRKSDHFFIDCRGKDTCTSAPSKLLSWLVRTICDRALLRLHTASASRSPSKRQFVVPDFSILTCKLHVGCLLTGSIGAKFFEDQRSAHTHPRLTQLPCKPMIISCCRDCCIPCPTGFLRNLKRLPKPCPRHMTRALVLKIEQTFQHICKSLISLLLHQIIEWFDPLSSTISSEA
jgi:hypothetical protein